MVGGAALFIFTEDKYEAGLKQVYLISRRILPRTSVALETPRGQKLQNPTLWNKNEAQR